MAKEPGLSEDQTKYQTPREEDHRWSLKIGPDGRIVVPVAASVAIALDEVGAVTAVHKDGELALASRRVAIRRIREMLKPYRSETGSVADEFTAEKRGEAAREDQEN